ncbi:MAG: prepilin-type N-terminal cleavage/methylation domain-containing protein [Gammaproteobacteria bacterium]|nr:prepilin-type N-terminal cleavage/methylation domain-containing protein [Gammaproteobacteria bacterium]
MDDPSKHHRVIHAAARQRGYSLLEMSLAVGAIAIIAVIAFLAFTDTQTSANQTRALNEINSLASSARQFRSSFAQGGLYTNLTNVKALVDNGYTTGGMALSGNDGVNVYGMSTTIAPTAGTGNGDATIVYTTPTQEDCVALMGSFTDSPGTTATTATDEHVSGFKPGAVCTAAGALTLIIE